MRNLSAFLCLALAAPAFAAAPSQWKLESSKLSYTVNHTLHTVKGVSTLARGKGICDDKDGCRFLIASPVNSFDSGDTNRDLHMIETVRGAQFPMVSVKTSMPAEPSGGSFNADLDIEFAGKKHTYKDVAFEVAGREGGALRFTGTIPLSIKDFEIEAPSLLGMAIKDSVPVAVDMTWKKQ